MPNDTYIGWRPTPMPEYRGTSTILITCLPTLFICAWSALHLNIPLTKPTWWRRHSSRSIWLALALFFPEILLAFTWYQFREALRVRNLANMELGFDNKLDGGIVEGDGLLDASKSKSCPRQHCWTIVHGFYAEMGGFAFETRRQRVILTSHNLGHILAHQPELVSDISEASIMAKSQSNGLATFLYFLQMIWFFTHIIIRLAQHLILTLLEITTLARILTLLAVYALWWYKPLGIKEPTLIPKPDEDACRHIGAGKISNINFHEFVQVVNNSTFAIISMSIAVLFGAPHFLAWNASFPTRFEGALWQISICIILCIGLYGGVSLIAPNTAATNIVLPGWIATIIVVVSVFAYVFASLFLLMESIRQLFHLPLNAFNVPNWWFYFPHFT